MWFLQTFRIREGTKRTKREGRGVRKKIARCLVIITVHLINLIILYPKRSPSVRWGGQGRAGQGRAGQGRAGQGRAGQGRAGQGRAGQGGYLFSHLSLVSFIVTNIYCHWHPNFTFVQQQSKLRPHISRIPSPSDQGLCRKSLIRPNRNWPSSG